MNGRFSAIQLHGIRLNHHRGRKMHKPPKYRKMDVLASDKRPFGTCFCLPTLVCHMEWKKAEFLADRVVVPNGQTHRGGGVSGSRNCGRT